MLSIHQTCFLVYAQHTLPKNSHPAGGQTEGVTFKHTHFQMPGAAIDYSRGFRLVFLNV